MKLTTKISVGIMVTSLMATPVVYGLGSRGICGSVMRGQYISATTRGGEIDIEDSSASDAAMGSKSLSVEQFERLLVTRSNQDKEHHRKPSDVEAALLKQLQSGRYVTDESVVAVVNAWSAYESPSPTAASKILSAEQQFPNTLRLIKAVHLFTYGRPFLKASLHQIQASLLRICGDSAVAAKELQVSLDVLTPFHLMVDQSRMNSLVEEGETLYVSGAKEQAQVFFLEALSYDWYKVEDPEALQTLKDLYVRAGRGLIDCRRQNLKALQEIVFVPAASDELGAYLAKAIQDAGGKPPERPEPVRNGPHE